MRFHCGRCDRWLELGAGCEHIYVSTLGHVWAYRSWAHSRTWEIGMPAPVFRAWPPEAG